MSQQTYITIGKISGVFGVKGAVKVFSYTEPRANILTYGLWRLSKGTEVKNVTVLNGQAQGKLVVAMLSGVSDRDKALLLNGWEIQIARSSLPATNADQYYWADLQGLAVETIEGVALGRVDYLLETGANDVLVVKSDKERLIPFLHERTVKSVDLAAGKIIVDWDPDF